MPITPFGTNPVTVSVTGANTTTSPSNALQDINASIIGQIASGATVDGFGLQFNSTSPVAGTTIAITNDGTVSTDQNSNFALLVNAGAAGGPNAFGDFTYSGSGDLTNTGSGGDALSITNPGPAGNIDVTISGTSTITASDTGTGIEASNNGTGTVLVTVQANGMVQAGRGVAFGNGVDTLDNSGNIEGTGDLGIGVSGSVATVTNSKTISATAVGVAVDNVTLTNNSGAMIETTGTTATGALESVIAAVDAVTAGDITNKSGATIQATGPLGQVGILIGQTNNTGAPTATGAATVHNAGAISGSLDGVNTSTTGTTTITNSGSIMALGSVSINARSGIRVDTATIENDQGGLISGLNGIFFRNDPTAGQVFGPSIVFNDGTVTGTGATTGFGSTPIAIHFSAGSTGNTLTLGTDSVINGNVLGAGSDIFQLGGTGSASFNVSNIGAAAQYQGFSTFNKIDTSTWTLTGTGANAWTVEHGTLQVDGTIGNTTVQNGAMLDGTGTTGALTVESGGTLAPGDDPGTITTGDLDLQSGSTLSIEIEGTSPGVGGFSDVVVNGSVTLGGMLSTNLLNGFTPQAGDSFEIINNDGIDAVSGTFSGLGQGASFTQGGITYSISYQGGDGNDVVLSVLTVGSDIAPQTDLNGPGAGNDNTASFANAPVLIAPAGTVTDADNAKLTSLTATLTARPDGDAAESLALNATAGAVASADSLTVTYTAATGTLSVTGLASTADYQSILQGIVYDDTSGSPNTTDRNVDVVVNDGTDPSITHSVTISVQSNAVSGQTVLNSATEGTAIASGTPVATFNDPVLTDTAGDFTASINWGDGTTDTGAAVTITGSSGSFTVKGGHTYADEGSEPLSVTLTRTSDNSSGTATGNVSVADADNIVVTADNFGGNPGVAINNVQVATFTDFFAGQVAGDLDATIDWGDGTVTAGTISGSGGSFTVDGSHTYAAGGNFPFSVTVDDAGGTSATATGTANIVFSGQTVLTNATEGTALNNQPVATFSDGNLADKASDFSASINWGDGTTDTGAAVTITGSSGSFTVAGSHTYADEGTEPLSVTFTRTSDNDSATATGSVSVADADNIVVTADNFGGNPGVAINNVRVATFTDLFAGQVAGDLAATIDWGDGTVTAGTISGGGGSFTVDGSHTYTAGGNFPFSVTVDDPGGATATATGTANIVFSGQAVLTNASEGTALNNQPVATFSDGNLSDKASDFTASINWGDGTTDTGAAVTVTGSSGSFTVAGSHTYADEGTEPLSVTLTRTADNDSATATGSVSVADADIIVVTADNFGGNPGVAINNTQVATFSDLFAAQVPGDLDATIDWGDGTVTAGTISGSGGSFTVDGSHTYTAGGNFTFSVTVDDPGGASATATGNAAINFAGQMVLTNATEGAALPNNTKVATFSDGNGSDTTSSFTAMIDWGDGVKTSGSVIGGGGTFTIEGGHTYADEGSDTATVILTRTSDQASATVSGGVAIAEADMLTPHGTSFMANARQVFSGTVATFDDIGFPGNVAGDFTASIDWGDGQTTSGSVSGGNGSAFTVSGSHTYAAAGQDTVKVKLTDDAPGTATATATTTATVNQGASFPFDVNGDTISDLVFQNNGQPGVWLWNGTAPTAEVGLTNPGASWHIITSRDVNGDGKADLIWQNTDGTPGVWLMNGTTPIAEVGLSNPGSSWHVVASGDTNGDGNSDLIWQNTDGTLGVWLMNGTTPTAERGLGNPGANWKVVGAADYSGDGNDDILLQDRNTGNLMIDLMNGTTISSSKTITVGDPSWDAVSTGTFNGQAEIAWQNNNGTAGIWLMNGTTPAAEVGLQNPGAGWQLLSVDHFTPDGHADLLFQNSSNNALQLWEMNGTSVAAMVNLPNPGAGWQSVNGHSFAVG